MLYTWYQHHRAEDSGVVGICCVKLLNILQGVVQGCVALGIYPLLKCKFSLHCFLAVLEFDVQPHPNEAKAETEGGAAEGRKERAGER